MAAPWQDIQRNIFAGESGGDYGALFGYSQRPGGQFAGVDVTDMTINDLLAFQDPSGPYGQWVKGKVGRVSTPAGAYQVVGRTLRDAKNALGLTGNERFTPELQDRIGRWVYETQGTKAWEGYKPGAAVAADTLAALGKEDNAMATPMMPGLLAQDVAAAAQPMQQPAAPTRDYGNLLDALAIGFSGMSLRPNQGLAQLAQSRIKARQDERRLAQTTSRTAAWLKSQGAEDLAQLAEMDPKTALTLYAARSKGDTTALQKNYEFLTGLGISPEEALQTVSSGTNVNIDMGEKAGVKFAEAFAAADAKTVADVSAAGSAADRNLGRLDRLEELLARAPQGLEGGLKLALGQLGFVTEGLNEAQAAQGLINSLVPEQRPEGSGPMSDADLALFKQSLPRIINQPGGNRLILDTMRRINEYDRQGALIVQELRVGKIDRAEAIRRLQSRADPLQGVPMGGSPTAAPAPADDERARALRLLLGE